jgi:hypothetical protein
MQIRNIFLLVRQLVQYTFSTYQRGGPTKRLLKPLVVDVPIVPIKQQCEEQQRLGWLYPM